MDDLKPDDESVDTPLVSPFLDSDDDSDDGEVLNELEEYGNAGKLCRQRVINSLDGDDLAFQCMIGFRKFVAYFDPFLPMNIITCKAYNTIMVEGLESTGRNLVAIVRDVYKMLFRRNIDACPNAKEMWIAIKYLKQGESFNKQDVKNKLFWEFLNEILAERLARNANPLTLVAATQHYPYNYPQAPKTYQTQAPSPRQTTSTKSHATTRSKGKEIVKAPLHHLSMILKKIVTSSNTKNKNIDNSLRTDKRTGNDRQTRQNFAKECRSSKWVKDYAYRKEKMLLCKKDDAGVQLSGEQSEWLHDTDDEPDEHIIVVGVRKNHTSIAWKSLYDSMWQSRIHLFIKGRNMHNNLQDDLCMSRTLNIILPIFPPDVYALVNHQEAAKDIWDKVKMLMKGTELSYQERECRLYNLFDKFAHVPGETLYEYYWRFSQLINDMHTIGMTMQQVQVNTKFLNALPSEWSKFVTDVKLAKSLYTTNYDQLYAYLSQHERHANEVRINRERYPDSLAFVANSPTLYNPSQLPQHSSYSMEDPIECINKAMAFLSAVASRFPPSKNQLRTSSNPRNQATIQDGRVTVQQVQGRQHQSYAEAQEAGQILDEEQLAFLADPGISEALVAQQTIPQNSAFQTDDLDAYDSDCDDLSSAKAVLMANLSSCDPEVLSEVPYFDSYPNDMINQDVQEMQYSEQTHVDDFKDNEIHSGSNIILYSQYLQESQDAVIQDTNPSAPNDLLVLSLVEQMTDHVAHLDKENQTNKMVNESLTAELERYKERITIFEQRLNVDLNKREKLIDSQMDDLIRDRNAKLVAFQQEIDTLKETLSNNVKEKESLSKTLTVFKTESKEKESNVIAKEHAVISVIDDEETLILEEESRSKMLDKQNDPISIEKKIKISPIDYSKLNKIKEDFGKCFIAKKELSAEQAFWLKHSSLSETPVTSHTPVKFEAPSELPKVLKDTFNAFDKTIIDEITEVQTIFNQMEAAVDQCSVDKNGFDIQIKQLRIANDQLLNQIMSQEIVHIVANSLDILDVSDPNKLP
ncbi:hypothetical protein Tco_0596190 [Tanacetum coccineum]